MSLLYTVQAGWQQDPLPHEVLGGASVRCVKRTRTLGSDQDRGLSASPWTRSIASSNAGSHLSMVSRQVDPLPLAHSAPLADRFHSSSLRPTRRLTFCLHHPTPRLPSIPLPQSQLRQKSKPRSSVCLSTRMFERSSLWTKMESWSDRLARSYKALMVS